MVDTVRRSTVVRSPHPGLPWTSPKRNPSPPTASGYLNRPALVDRLIDSRTIPMVAISHPPDTVRRPSRRLGGAGRPTVRLGVGARGRRGPGGVPLPRGRASDVRGARRGRPPGDRIPWRRQPGPCDSPTGPAISTRVRPSVLVLDELDRRRSRSWTRSLRGSVTPRGVAIASPREPCPTSAPPVPRRRGPPRDRRGRPRPAPVAARRLLRGAGFQRPRPRLRSSPRRPRVAVGLYWRRCPTRTAAIPGAPDPFLRRGRFIVDYVRSEVLKPLSRERQRILTRTSILERLSGPLCDANLQRSGSSGTLERSARRPPRDALDRERQGYRYHVLFRDVDRQLLHVSPTWSRS